MYSEDHPVISTGTSIATSFLTSPVTWGYLIGHHFRGWITDTKPITEGIKQYLATGSTEGTILSKIGVPRRTITNKIVTTLIGKESTIAKEKAVKSISDRIHRKVVKYIGSEIHKDLKEGGLQEAWNKAKSLAVELGVSEEATGVGGAKLLLGSLASTAITAMNAAFAVETLVEFGSLATNVLYEIGKPPDITPRIYDTPASVTMRQTALQAIYDSQLSTRSAFGREATFLHR